VEDRINSANRPIQGSSSQAWAESGRKLGQITKRLLERLQALDGFGRLVVLLVLIGLVISTVIALQGARSYFPEASCGDQLLLRMNYDGSVSSCYFHFALDGIGAIVEDGWSFLCLLAMNVFYLSIVVATLFCIRWVASGFRPKA